jgi:hypothetical protein
MTQLAAQVRLAAPLMLRGMNRKDAAAPRRVLRPVAAAPAILDADAFHRALGALA